jgi:hypothetical protein
MVHASAVLFQKYAALILPAFFSTVWTAPTAESELMLYPCTISAVKSSFDHDNPRPTPRVFDDGSRPRAAVAGCAGVMSPTFMVTVIAVASATAAARRRRWRRRSACAAAAEKAGGSSTGAGVREAA